MKLISYQQFFKGAKKVVLTIQTYGRCAREGERGVERKEKRNGKRKSRAKRNPKKRGERRRGRPQKVSGLSAPASFEKVNHCDINPTFSRLSSARRPSPPPTRLLPQKRKNSTFFKTWEKRKKTSARMKEELRRKSKSPQCYSLSTKAECDVYHSPPPPPL